MGQDLLSSTILCIEDSKTEQKKMKTVLSKAYKVEMAASGEQAFELLSDGLMPQLILLDLTLPGMDGITFIQRLMLYPQYEQVPVIFVTSDASTQTESKCLALGAMDFIKKPYNGQILLRRVERALFSSSVTNYMSKAIKRYESSIEAEHRQFRRFMHQMLKALSLTIDAKDEYTRGHSSRVAFYSQLIGKGMGLDDSFIDNLHYAGLLHDIGKIGVADVVLRKPGKLSESELVSIRDHPVIGYNILQGVSSMPEIAQGARWHHEKYDGSGYPDGMVGDDIPLTARIICVADSFDAMTSKRSYQMPRTYYAALGELIKCKNTQFDPEVADAAVAAITAFLDNGGEVPYIYLDDNLPPNERRL
jgi:putative two-component system response regulator